MIVQELRHCVICPTFKENPMHVGLDPRDVTGIVKTDSSAAAAHEKNRETDIHTGGHVGDES